MNELLALSAIEMVSRLRNGSTTIAEALDCLRTRIANVDQTINALPTVCFDRAYEHAQRLQKLPADKRGRLCGLPVTIKDLNLVSGVRTTFGSAVHKDYIAPKSDQLVGTIEADGGVIYAKSNTPEFGAGGITFNDVFGITRNPHNPQLSSGGSSGGAAASLASGCAWLSQGSDMAGSLRTPASFCGVTSLRPSPGSIRGSSEFLPFQVLGVNGPMARDVADLALFADVMRADDSDRMQASAARGKSVEVPLSDVRVASSLDLGVTAVSTEIADAFNALLDNLDGHCHSRIDAAPDLSGVHDAFDVLRAENFAVNLEQTLNTQRSLLKPELVWNIEKGLSLTSAKIRQALRAQGQIINNAASFMQPVDVLICPAACSGPVDASLRYPGDLEGVPVADYYRWLAIAYATTMTCLPIITLPVGTLGNGMPFGVQLVGKPYGEAALFKIASELESLVSKKPIPVDI